MHLRTQHLGSAEKSGLRDGKRADFIRNWRRSRLKNPDKPKIFIKKNVRNHSYHQFYPVLAKIWITRIRINRVLLYVKVSSSEFRLLAAVVEVAARTVTLLNVQFSGGAPCTCLLVLFRLLLQ